MELVKIKRIYNAAVDLIALEQFANSCAKDLSILLQQSDPKTLDKLSRLADQYCGSE